MRTFLMLVVITIASGNLNAQNLVPNSDFEHVRDSVLPKSWLIDAQNLNHYIYDWYTPTGTSTDLHHISAYSCWACMPKTGEGVIFPHSGKVVAGFINYTSDGGCSPLPWHEYLGVELIEPMREGIEYCVEFWVALSCSSTYATNNIGILFTTNAIKRNGCAPILITPQINNSELMATRGKWVLVRSSFIADSAYTHITIGNFFSDSGSLVVALDAPGSPAPVTPEGYRNEYSYYFIDDIFVGICPMAKGESEEKLVDGAETKNYSQASFKMHFRGNDFFLKQLICDIGGK